MSARLDKLLTKIDAIPRSEIAEAAASLGMREPLENPEPTHGVCGIHEERRDHFPPVELLIVVRRNGTLYKTLGCAFASAEREGDSGTSAR